MNRFLLIDADVLVYQSAFGAQKTRYVIRHEGDERVFEDAKARDAWLLDKGLTKDDVHEERFLDVLDESAALIIAQRNLQHLFDELKTDQHQMYLTGKGNFREKVAVTKPYKGNRQSDKPVHYDLVRQWYINQGAVVVNGYEADDAIGLMCTRPGSVICTIDKDLNQLPGPHYDWGKGIKYRVSEYDGQRYFLAQLLAGDPTDNIPGIARYGMATAFKALDSIEGLTEKWEQVKTIYKDKGHDEAYLDEQGKLLWMQRSELCEWTPQSYTEFLEKLQCH